MDRRELHLRELTFGALCRVGVAISTCFWIPLALLTGLLGMFGELPVAGTMGATDGLAGFVAGVLQSIACSILNDVIVVIGAALLTLSNRFGWRSDVMLRRRSTAGDAREA